MDNITLILHFELFFTEEKQIEMKKYSVSNTASTFIQIPIGFLTIVIQNSLAVKIMAMFKYFLEKSKEIFIKFSLL